MREAILQVENLHKSFGGLKAVNGVRFELFKEDIHAVIGPNGAGKTTLFNLITGYLKPDQGRIMYRGDDVTGIGGFKLCRRGVVRSFQVAAIYPMLTVSENVQVAMFSRHSSTYRFLKRAKKLFRDNAEEVLKEVGLLGQAGVTGGKLSQGDRKRLELAIVIANEPKVMLLDEPTAGMSPDETKQTMDLIQRIRDERNLTILFTEHDMSFVFGISKRIMVLHQGGIIADGHPDDVKANELVRNIYLGEDTV